MGICFVWLDLLDVVDNHLSICKIALDAADKTPTNCPSLLHCSSEHEERLHVDDDMNPILQMQTDRFSCIRILVICQP